MINGTSDSTRFTGFKLWGRKLFVFRIMCIEVTCIAKSFCNSFVDYSALVLGFYLSVPSYFFLSTSHDKSSQSWKYSIYILIVSHGTGMIVT